MSTPVARFTFGPWEVRHKRSIHPVGREFVAVAVAEQHDKNAEWNARLIAAAPDLLESLIELADIIARLSGDIDLDEMAAAVRARQVIDRALGAD